MSIDLAQFHQIFFEESFEGLETMESALLDLNVGDVDSETINAIFRAAHSIKGGSGTFGFTDVSSFTHIMETLLDEMRDGRRTVTQSGVNVLLGAVDCLRDMLAAIQEGENPDQDKVDSFKLALNNELNGNSESSNRSTESATTCLDAPVGNPTIPQGWRIAFSPHAGLLKTGNDPVRIFRELNSLGEATIRCDLQGLPKLNELDPEECHLSWLIELKGDITRESVDEIFDWVEEHCDLAIQPWYGDKTDDEEEVVQQFEANEPVSAPENASASTQSTDSETTKSSPETLASEIKPETKNKASASIRVDTHKIDTLINMVGELVITQSMLSLVGGHFEIGKLDQLKSGLAQLERHTRELQESVMNIRMMPISFVFSRFPRLVHDLSAKLGKKIELKLVGENTEVDKTVVELLSDPLVHLVRNSLDHGIEMPDERLAANKTESGRVTLEAYHRGGNIVIEIADDGRGLDKDKLRKKAIEKNLVAEDAALTDKQIYELIFMPGFSTAEQLTDLSGRGVGMDVVKRNIQSLGGNIEILSELGQGTTIKIHLPLTLAILDGQAVAVGDETYIIPLGSIIESVHVTEEMINRVAGKGETFRLRQEYLPIIRMHEIFSVNSAKATKLTEGLLVIVDGQGARYGLFVDDLLIQQQVVVKSLEANYRSIEGISGATILGDGSVALILDIPGLLRLSNR